GLRDRAQAQRLRRQHEIADIGAAIDGAIDTERLVGVNHGDMRRAEEVVVLQGLLRVRHLVPARDTERAVELNAAFAAALQIDAEIFARRREVVAFLRARGSRGVDGLAKTLLGLAAGDDDLPGLAIAP